ncbi:hypothetical protein HYFRA_00001078 [Hymenoscyphus fraxineus]|uniref:Amino acid permease/ SLC12A domain-containing protein n=1 Tax=Hymenoscyphus fraxineus TaxID=746836 RepID=A0A9N9KTC5_9HELO|nr:hypothetical protein HYFRA_00001078 [Hymenoscyphus fraxineus]
MAHAKSRFEDGLELAHYRTTESTYSSNSVNNNYGGTAGNDYGGMEVNEYGGMEAHEYGGNTRAMSPDGGYPYPDDSSEKIPFASKGHDNGMNSKLRRDLKTRQMSMIALGGALGTGLLINTGPYLARSGPVSMLLGYGLVGVLCYSVMAGMGEMATWLPLASGFTGFATRFVDPALGFATGWTYWLEKYIVTTPNNLIASTLIIRYWFDKEGYDGPGSNPAIYVALFLVAIIAINYFGVGVFGEFEFWLSSSKVLIMLSLIIFTFIMAIAGGSNAKAPGFKYWKEPGAFAPYVATGSLGKFLGFWDVLSSAVFSFLGAELVGVTIGEAQNPRKAVPKAIKLTFFRIVFFYIVLIFLLGLNIPYDSALLLSANREGDRTVSASASPFVVAATLAGYKAIPDLINVCLLIFTFSAANSDLYISTRSLYSLAIDGNAPRIFARTNDRGVPVYALGVSSGLALLAFISVDVGSFATFQYFVSLVTIFGILTWVSILISHIFFVRARYAQIVPDTALAYVSPFGIKGSLISLIFALVILLFNGFADFSPDPVTGEKFRWRTFVVNYIGVFIFLGMIAGYKIFMKSKILGASEADLWRGKDKIDADENEYLAREEMKMKGHKEGKWEKLYRVTLGNFF